MRVRALRRLQELEAGHAGQFQVRQHQVNFFLAKDFQSALRVGRGARGVTRLGKVQLEQPRHLGFVFDYQDRGHLFHFRLTIEEAISVKPSAVRKAPRGSRSCACLG